MITFMSEVEPNHIMCSAAQYDDPSQPILAAYDGSQSDLVLRLPRGVTVRWGGGVVACANTMPTCAGT